MLTLNLHRRMLPPKGGDCMKGQIYPNRDGYVVRFGNVSKRFGGLKEAERFLNGLRFKTDEKTFDERDYKKSNPLSFTNVSEKWRLVKKTLLRPNSYRSLCNHLAKAQGYFGHINVREIKYGNLEDFSRTIQLSGKTIHNVMLTLHSFFNWLKQREEIQKIPEFPKIRFELGYRKTIDKDVQQQILDDIEKNEPFKVWLGIRFLATYISIRPMELMNITYSNMDLKNGYLYIPNPKEKKYKAVPIIPQDTSCLSCLPVALPGNYLFGENGKRYGVNRFYRAWKRACDRLGIIGVDLYGGTRHSSARALRTHFSPEEIKRATMHTSNAAFERYFKMDGDDVRSIYKRSAEVIPIGTSLVQDLAPILEGSK
jgi:integrase